MKILEIILPWLHSFNSAEKDKDAEEVPYKPRSIKVSFGDSAVGRSCRLPSCMALCRQSHKKTILDTKSMKDTILAHVVQGLGFCHDIDRAIGL